MYLFVWIIWIVALLVLYHKIFEVYYFSLGHGLMKELITAGIIGLFMTGLTFYLWWLTAIIIIICGIVLKNKVSSNIPLIAAIILAIIVAIMGISFRASNDSDMTTASLVMIENKLEN